MADHPFMFWQPVARTVSKTRSSQHSSLGFGIASHRSVWQTKTAGSFSWENWDQGHQDFQKIWCFYLGLRCFRTCQNIPKDVCSICWQTMGGTRINGKTEIWESQHCGSLGMDGPSSLRYVHMTFFNQFPWLREVELAIPPFQCFVRSQLSTCGCSHFCSFASKTSTAISCCHWGLWGFGSCDKSSATTCARSKPEYAHITFFKRPPIFLAHPNVLPKKEPIFLIGRFAGFFFLIFPSSIFMLFSLPRCCHWRPRPQVVSIALASWCQICRQQTWAFVFGENKRVASMVLVDYWCLETPHLREKDPGLAAFSVVRLWFFFEVMTGWIYSKFQKTSEHLPWSLEIEQEVNSE